MGLQFAWGSLLKIDNGPPQRWRAPCSCGTNVPTAFLRRGGKFAIDGEKLDRSIQSIGPDDINRTFGDGRAQALADLATILDRVNPAAEFQQKGFQGIANRVLNYSANRMIFEFAVSGSTAGVAGLAGNPALAGTLIVAVPLVEMARLALNSPAAIKSLRRVIDSGATEGALSAWLRSVAAGDFFGSLEEDAPPRL